MRRATLVSSIFAALLAGVALGRLSLQLPLVLLLTAALALAAASLRRRSLLLPALMLAALVLGLWREQAWVAHQSQLLGLVGDTIAVTATVSDDPGFDDARHTMDFRATHLRRLDGRPLPGDIRVRMYQTNLHRGYTVQLEGKLKPPYYSGPPELGYPRLTVLSTDQSWLERLRQRFFVGMRTALPEPVASFSLGLLVGVRGLIPKPLQEELALVGLSHLVAVSGYNLTIIVNAAHKLFARFGRGAALAASLWLIGGFLLVTGASASIVRAAFVAVLGLLAMFYGRRFHPLALILLAAGTTAAWNPAYLTDIGWLLSFLAFFGIMVAAPAVTARLGQPKLLAAQLFIESSTAQLMTVPLILYIFGDLSIVAPLTNLLILPLVPLAMLLGFIAGLAGMLLPAFAGWLAWPAQVLMGFALSLIDQFAALPWAGAKFHLSFIGMVVFYGLIIAIVALLGRSNPHRRPSAPPLPTGGLSAILH